MRFETELEYTKCFHQYIVLPTSAISFLDTITNYISAFVYFSFAIQLSAYHSQTVAAMRFQFVVFKSYYGIGAPIAPSIGQSMKSGWTIGDMEK